MTSVTKKVSESIEKVSIYTCEKCNYVTNVKSNYKKHCLTARHRSVTNVTDGDIIVPESIVTFPCIKCGKVYNSRNGLWCHSKKCVSDHVIQTSIEENLVIDTNLIIKLIQQNENLQQLLIQQAKDHQEETKQILTVYSNEKSELINKLVEREPANNVVNNTTNNNQKFNLNFFLNETCKDAMNIQEFMENLRITFQDLLTIGNEGFVNGLSDIFIKQLQDLDVSKRPIHCTDSKRETIYFKEEDVWNKDDKDKTRLKQLIEKVEYKNVVALRQWCNENPDANVNNTPNNLLRDKIYLETLQGDERTRDKIIKNMVKEVIVDKEPEH